MIHVTDYHAESKAAALLDGKRFEANAVSVEVGGMKVSLIRRHDRDGDWLEINDCSTGSRVPAMTIQPRAANSIWIKL